MSVGVIVLGMHRGGTSCLTGVLKILGASLGENVAQVHFENKDIRELNDSILAYFKSSWNHVQSFPMNWESMVDMAPFKAKLKKLVESQFSGNSFWAIKDPRICLLLPLYLNVFNELKMKPKLIITRRPEEEIVRSLAVRNMMPFSHSLKLCRQYKTRLDYDKIKFQWMEIEFEDLIFKTPIILKQVILFLGLSIDMEKKINEINCFVNPKRKHHHAENANTLWARFSCRFPYVYLLKKRNLWKIINRVKKRMKKK